MKKMLVDTNDLLTTPKAARLIGTTRGNLVKMVFDGKLEPLMKCGKHFFFLRQSVLALKGKVRRRGRPIGRRNLLRKS